MITLNFFIDENNKIIAYFIRKKKMIKVFGKGVTGATLKNNKNGI